MRLLPFIIECVILDPSTTVSVLSVWGQLNVIFLDLLVCFSNWLGMAKRRTLLEDECLSPKIE